MKLNRKLMVVLTVLMTAMGANAQVTTTNGQAWWGYWNTEMELQPVGYFDKGTNTCAIRIAALSQPMLRGCKIEGLRFYISDKTAVTAATVWLSAKTFGNSGKPDLASKEIPVSQLRDQLHDGAPTEVLFDEALSPLPASNIYASVYAGVTLTLSKGDACEMLTSGKMADTPANANIFNWTNIESSYGALAMQLLLSGGNLKPKAVGVEGMGEQILAMNEPNATIEATITNWGTQPLNSIDYRVDIDGTTATERRITLDRTMNELGVSRRVRLPFDTPTEPRLYAGQLHITKADGQTNESDDGTTDAQIVVLQQKALKRAVMEEFTGTWCPNCVRGIAGMHILEEMFGDRFIGIAVHTGNANEDPMGVSEYMNSAIKKRAAATGVPSASIDRQIDCDPYRGIDYLQPRFLTDLLVEQQLQQTTVADMDISAQWTDAAEKTIRTDVATTFRYSAAEAPYRLILVYGSNGLKGEGNVWLQINGLYGKGDEETEEYLHEYAYGPKTIKMEYNHVAIATEGIDNGIEGSISLPLASGETQHFCRERDMSQNRLVQDKSKVFVVAMLMDTRSGNIVNAAKTTVKRFGTNGIVSVADTTRNNDNAIYDLQGRKVGTTAETSRPVSKGIYISSGRKVVLR